MALEKILVVGKQHRSQQLARPFAKKLYAADEAEDVRELIDAVRPDMLFFDAGFSREQITGCLLQLKKDGIDLPAIIMGKSSDKFVDDNIENCPRVECVEDPDDAALLCHAIERLTADQNESAENRYFIEDCPSSVSIVGKSRAAVQALRMIRLVANSACNPVLIIGETGTGKELAARALHILRHGSQQKFVAVNCAALTANLLESELFGHVRGSFTSADREKTGLLELAGTGTVFLDEISEMPLDLQSKLLRVLQEKTFRKVGGIDEIQCKATIITSSNRDLHAETENGRFRRDLYYRLSVCPIPLAPLRAESRREDILLLAEYFIQHSTICPDKTGRIKGITKMAAEALIRHNWPGNVRELKNVIERAILLETGERIGAGNLLLNPKDMFPEADNPDSAGTLKLNDFSLEKAEKELVKKALEEAGWQKTRAAALLGITRATLYAKVKQYDLQEPVSAEPALK